MTVKLKMTLYVSMLAILVAFGIWGAMTTIQHDAEIVVRREAAPKADRAGEININNSTAYLWTFDFEGRRCLWVTQHAGRGGRGGLTCWEPKP